MALIIDIDQFKELIPGYKPSNAEKFHHQSMKLANGTFLDALKSSTYKKVILMSGGSASGKSEFLDAYLKAKKAIIYDSTLSSIEGFQIKYKLSQKYAKKIEIYAIWPEDLLISFIAFLNRDRKFPYEHFFKTHSRSRKVLLWILRNYPEIKIHLYLNTYDNDIKLKYKKLEFASRIDQGKYILKEQQSEQALMIAILYKSLW